MKARLARICLPAALALAALGVAGCGGGGGGSAATTAPATTETTAALSREELIAQGDAICAEVNAAVGTVVSTGAESEGRVAQEAGLYGGMVDRLKGLGAPEDSAGYAEFIAAAEALAQAESNAKLAAERGEGAALAAAESEASSALASFKSAAQTYGFEKCEEAPSAPSTGSSTEEAPEEGSEGVEEEAAPEEVEPAPETGGAEEGAGGGAAAGGGTGGGSESSGGGSSGGIGPG
jgi:hypothetical protein